MRSLAIALVLVTAVGLPAGAGDITEAQAAAMMSRLQASHIAANVPPERDFAAFLTRDFAKYFGDHGVEKPSIHYELLRNEPTQSGVAYPKFCAWVRASNANGKVAEGVARVAAVNRTGFEVTHFVPRDQIALRPDDLRQVIPAALIGAAIARAGRP